MLTHLCNARRLNLFKRRGIDAHKGQTVHGRQKNSCLILWIAVKASFGIGPRWKHTHTHTHMHTQTTSASPSHVRIRKHSSCSFQICRHQHTHIIFPQIQPGVLVLSNWPDSEWIISFRQQSLVTDYNSTVSLRTWASRTLHQLPESRVCSLLTAIGIHLKEKAGYITYTSVVTASHCTVIFNRW